MAPAKKVARVAKESALGSLSAMFQKQSAEGVVEHTDSAVVLATSVEPAEPEAGAEAKVKAKSKATSKAKAKAAKELAEVHAWDPRGRSSMEFEFVSIEFSVLGERVVCVERDPLGFGVCSPEKDIATNFAKLHGFYRQTRSRP